MCGGTSCCPPIAGRPCGLSPRVRGNRFRNTRRPGAAGSIPACAGEPSCSWSSVNAGPVYPRVCGGTRKPGVAATSTMGLSPRVRGNRPMTPPPPSAPPSIPACAGEPASQRSISLDLWVYPRVCGGTTATATGRPARKGLSPRVRGNRYGRAASLAISGSIPACAGEPPHHDTAYINAQIYPRVCGGTPPGRRKPQLWRDLSPRVRGNPPVVPLAKVFSESIPACAGEPGAGQSLQPDDEVYPRVCGGTAVVSAVPPLVESLSPRVRGNPLPEQGSPPPGRSIPACAGEPPFGDYRVSDARVYPRVCGGTGIVGVKQAVEQGLSPRVRGNPSRLASSRVIKGSIPACAGEPRRKPA